jgi:hypothetical protein
MNMKTTEELQEQMLRNIEVRKDESRLMLIAERIRREMMLAQREIADEYRKTQKPEMIVPAATDTHLGSRSNVLSLRSRSAVRTTENKKKFSPAD